MVWALVTVFSLKFLGFLSVPILCMLIAIYAGFLGVKYLCDSEDGDNKAGMAQAAMLGLFVNVINCLWTIIGGYIFFGAPTMRPQTSSTVKVNGKVVKTS